MLRIEMRFWLPMSWKEISSDLCIFASDFFHPRLLWTMYHIGSLQRNNPLDQSSPLESFWTTKILNYSASKWGYNSLTLPISIHLTLLGCLPFSPTRRYSAFPLHEVLTFLSRMTSSCNSLIYLGAKSSTKGICMLISMSMIIGGSYNLRFSTLTT